MKKPLAFFDFDGTITKKDTLLEFIKFSKGRYRFYSGLFLALPYLMAYKIKLVSNQYAKEKVLQFFFKDTPLEIFKQYCNAFTREVLPKLIRSKALQEIKRLQEKNIIVTVVSASPENWIIGWALENELQLIASRLEIKDGKITGKISGKNCHGNEKVCRIIELYDLTKFDVVAAYGDSAGDKPMLQLAKTAYYKPFVE